MKRLISILCMIACMMSIMPTILAEEAQESVELPRLVDFGTSKSKVEEKDGKIIFQTTGSDFWSSADTSSVYAVAKDDFEYGELSEAEFSASLNSIKVMSGENADRGSMGIMMRGSLDADAPNIYFRVDKGGGAMVTYRSQKGGSTKFQSVSDGKLPHKMRLRRKGNNVYADAFIDGKWKTNFSGNVEMGKEIYYCVSGFSHRAGDWLQGEISDIDYKCISLYNADDFAEYKETRRATSDLLAWENFEDGSMVLGENTPLNPIWSGAPEYIMTEQDKDGNRWWRRTGVTGSIFLGDNSWTDYSVSVRVKFASTLEKNTFNIIFRRIKTLQFSPSYLAVGFTGGNKLEMYKYMYENMNHQALLAECDLGYSYLDGKERTLRVDAVNEIIRVYVDDELKIEYEDSGGMLLYGSAGIYTETSDVLIDDFIVKKINDKHENYDNQPYNMIPYGLKVDPGLYRYMLGLYDKVKF